MHLQHAILSACCGRGMETAWNIYMESLSPSHQEFLLLQTEISDLAMEMLEQFVVLLYDHTSDITNANDSRKYLVTQKTRSFENLSPLKKC